MLFWVSCATPCGITSHGGGEGGRAGRSARPVLMVVVVCVFSFGTKIKFGRLIRLTNMLKISFVSNTERS